MGLYGIYGRYIKLSILGKAHLSSIHSAKTGQKISQCECIWQQKTTSNYLFTGEFYRLQHQHENTELHRTSPWYPVYPVPSQVAPNTQGNSKAWKQQKKMPLGASLSS